VQTPEGKEAALKRVKAENQKQFDDYQNEIDLLLKLRGSEHIIQVLDAEIDRKHMQIHIVMEAGDMDFHRLLQSEHKMSLPKLQDFWRQMLKALQVIHNARIVHSDLKPSNFVVINDKLKVIDFGIANKISNDTTNIYRESGGVGTLSYMAPETLKQTKAKFGRSSDIWSLGIVFYQMVFNRLPLPNLDPYQRMMTICNEDYKIEFPDNNALDQHPKAVQSQILDILESCLQRDPQRRPSIPELLDHAFLRQTNEVKSSSAEAMVDSIANSVRRLLTTQASSTSPQGQVKEWAAASDEVWECISSARSVDGTFSCESVSALAQSLACLAQSLAKDRDAAVDEASNLRARNKELEEQICHFKKRPNTEGRGSTGGELKDRGQIPRVSNRIDEKEKVSALGFPLRGLKENR